MKPFSRYLLMLAGTVSLAIGIVGIFIPILPTTPLLLLAAFCYIKSSDKLYRWLINHRYFGEYIYDYIHHKSIKKATKIRTIIFLWTMLIISMLVVKKLIVTIILVFVGVGVTLHIVTFKTLK